jgi:uncharacterized membrane protein
MSEQAESRSEFDYDRTVALSDGVFAIALTLLVLNIPLPADGDDLWSQLDDLLPNLGAYALSFAVLGFMWLRHHSFFRELRGIDRPLALLNLLYLGFVALIPFPTGLISERGDESAAVIVYALTIAASSAVAAQMHVVAERNGLTDPEPWSPLERFAVPLVFLASVPVALIDPTAGTLCWLALIPVGRWLDRPRAS